MKKDIFEAFPGLTAKHMKQLNSYFNGYIFYRNNKGGIKECWCTACNKHFTYELGRTRDNKDYEFINGKHNDRCECPHCHTKVTLKSVGIGKKNLTEKSRLVVLIPKGDALYIRAFYATKCYNGDPYNKMLNHMYTKEDEELLPALELSETARYYLKHGVAKMWKRQWYWGAPTDWYERDIIEPFYKSGLNSYETNEYYVVNPEALKESFLKYCDLQQWFDTVEARYNYQDPYPIKYLCNFAMYPCIEKLMKSDLADAVHEMVIQNKPNKRLINWETDKLSEVFKTLSGNEFKAFREYGSMEVLRTYSRLKKVFPTTKFEDVYKFRSTLMNNIQDMITLCTRYKISPKRAVNYIKKQNNDCISWLDYLGQAQELKYDMNNEVILMPKNLSKAHQNATDTLNAIKIVTEERNMKDRTKKLNKLYDFEYGDLEIIVPKSMQEIIAEGQKLQHCVGGYAERHAEGVTTILFIRKKEEPDKPYVTLEINDKTKNIIQYHGFRNEYEGPLPKEVKDFVAAFKEFVNAPKTKVRKNKKAAA